MRVWDVCQAARTLRSLDGINESPFWLQSQHRMAGVTLYSSLFIPEVRRFDLYQLPHTHREGPYLLNVRRVLDLPQTVAMVAERSQVVICDDRPENWEYPSTAVANLR